MRDTKTTKTPAPLSYARIRRIAAWLRAQPYAIERADQLVFCEYVLQHARSRIPLPRDCAERARTAHEKLNALAAAGAFADVK